jgi:hypothetical protein
MIFKLSILTTVCLIGLSSQAEQIGDIRFNAKVLSFDQKVVQIETAGQKFEIPRSVIKSGKLEGGQERELAMSKEDYQQMKAQAMYRESSKAAKAKK